MIRLEAVSKRFGEIQALAPIDIEIEEGEWLGVFGRNGSGKTSLLRILVGISRPSSGKIFLGAQESSAAVWRAFRKNLGFMPERIQFFENLTGEKTLRYFAELKGVDTRDVDPLLERVGLAKAARRKLGGYSKGMLQRLNFAQALLGNPKVLVVDEPIEGLDAQGLREFFEIVRSVEDRTVIFSSHRLPLISRFVHRICILSEGRVKALGTEAELHGQLKLPVRVIVHPMGSSNGHLYEALGKIGSVRVTRQPGRLEVSVPQHEKMQFLASLQSLAASIHDVRIEEPSLEEVLLETS